jgi:hypothetical protein
MQPQAWSGDRDQLLNWVEHVGTSKNIQCDNVSGLLLDGVCSCCRLSCGKEKVRKLRRIIFSGVLCFSSRGDKGEK